VLQRKTQLYLSMGLLLLILAIFYKTLFSMVNIWYKSGSFQHGFLIFPIVIYLVWLKRKEIRNVPLNVNFLGLVAIAALSILWMLADISGVQVIQHFVFIALIPALVLSCLGYKFARKLVFPLAYLFFAVPAGEPFIYPLQQITADIVMGALKLTTIPVYREGQFIYIPAGTFQVAEACSGIRFLTATFTLSVLFVYLEYKSVKKKIIFLLLAIIIPIIANGIRAFSIVLAGHFISMEFAGGADHIIFGWQFFGVVMFLMFWIGAKWSDRKNVCKT